MTTRTAARRRPAVRTAHHLADLAWATPTVVTQRLTRMAQAGPWPDARQQRESVQMVTEKAAATAQAWQAMARHMAGLWRPWTLWMSGLPTQPPGAAWWSASRLWQDAWFGMWASGLAPVRQRAVANARRLRASR